MGPVNPARQLHEYPLTKSVHVPPLRHGELEHSSISEKIKGQKKNVIEVEIWIQEKKEYCRKLVS